MRAATAPTAQSEYTKLGGRGRLRLGGKAVVRKPKKGKKKKKKKKRERDGDAPSAASAAAASARPTRVRGSGRLVTSGTSVMGHEGSSFLSELAVGDAIVVQHPTSLTEEARIVRMVLSDISISISSAFSSDLITTTKFEYLSAPKKAVDVSAEQGRKRQRKVKEEDAAFGTYKGGGGSTVTYRVKSGSAFGGYRIVTEQVKAGDTMSRAQLLDKRTKMKSDRFC